MTPAVSCLMPVYNARRFLAEAIRSILDQTFTDFELIVIDDGSTDGSSRIIDDLARDDSRIVVMHQANTGIVGALNNGLKAVRGRYVARMDADDISLPDRFMRQVRYLDDTPGCVLVGGHARIVRDDGEDIGRTTGGRHLKTDLTVFPPRISVSMHPLIMVRAAAMKAIGGYRSDYPHAEDYDLFIRLAAFGSIDNPDFDCLRYRRHDSALSVRHVEAQEAAAARAEIDAIIRARGDVPPAWLLERYIEMRVWRRYQTIDRAKAREFARKARASLFWMSPKSLLDRRFWRLRAIIAYNLVRDLRRRSVQV